MTENPSELKTLARKCRAHKGYTSHEICTGPLARGLARQCSPPSWSIHRKPSVCDLRRRGAPIDVRHAAWIGLADRQARRARSLPRAPMGRSRGLATSQTMDGSPSLRRRHRTAAGNSWAGFLHTRPLVSSLYRTAFDRRNLSANPTTLFAECYRSNSDAQGVVRNGSKAQIAVIRNGGENA